MRASGKSQDFIYSQLELITAVAMALQLPAGIIQHEEHP